jgi:hypothetical protein
VVVLSIFPRQKLASYKFPHQPLPQLMSDNSSNLPPHKSGFRLKPRQPVFYSDCRVQTCWHTWALIEIVRWSWAYFSQKLACEVTPTSNTRFLCLAIRFLMQRLARITIIPFDYALRRIFNLQNVLCDRIPNISIYKLNDLHISSSKIVPPGFLVHCQ